jgi:hypothetical protein
VEPVDVLDQQIEPLPYRATDERGTHVRRVVAGYHQHHVTEAHRGVKHLAVLAVLATDPVGAENWVTSCDLQVLVDEAAEPVLSEHTDGRPGTWRAAACGR